MKKKTKSNSFKDKLNRLEEIASLLEDEEIQIEDALLLYEEGVVLSNECLNYLQQSGLRITELKAKLNPHGSVKMNKNEDIPLRDYDE
ncbi:MAG TPA: exodeoxyribonuclease VII small subunit [Ignavibacteriaceae bacterium]|jgi:exodeoxyribonuclease VII small subunit|nr:exodeoxyribonuclease VII small subunit [Ignavibacteriaceae bacterium]